MTTLMAFTLFGCGVNTDTTDTIEVYAPDGAPALALAKLIAEDMQFEQNVNYTIVSPSNISNTITLNTADLAILPINAASKLALDGTKYKMLSVNTHGNLFIIGKEAKASLGDLKGKVLGVIGQALVPDLTLQYILKSNDIDYIQGDEETAGKVTLKYYASATELIPAIASGSISYGLLPEPAMTMALSMISGSQLLFDLQEEWGVNSYPQAVLLAKTSLIESQPEFITSFLSAMKDNEQWLPLNINDGVLAINAQVEEGATPSLVADKITAQVITNCHIEVVNALASKQSVIDYLTAIKTIADNSANIVGDDFFANI